MIIRFDNYTLYVQMARRRITSICMTHNPLGGVKKKTNHETKGRLVWSGLGGALFREAPSN